ncbi:hypothetical protein ACVWXO_007427 [Bradyrhizobium sp. LM2.7]
MSPRNFARPGLKFGHLSGGLYFRLGSVAQAQWTMRRVPPFGGSANRH